MTYTFTGKNEEDAVAKAVKELNIGSEMFDVEVIEEKKGFFKRSSVTIRVHLERDKAADKGAGAHAGSGKREQQTGSKKEKSSAPRATRPAKPKKNAQSSSTRAARPEAAERVEESSKEPDVDEAIARDAVSFLEQLLEHFGCEAQVRVVSRKNGKLVLSAESDQLSRIIGKGGRTLDALQTLVSSYANTKSNLVRVVLDAGGYRMEQEERLMQRAYEAAARVQSSGKDYIFEPLNAHDRRLIHMALKDVAGISTESDGNGAEKRLRIFKEF